MARRPSANMAVLKVKAELTRTLSDSAKCWRVLRNEGVVRLKTGCWYYYLLPAPTVRYVIFMIQRRSGTLRLEVFSRVQSNFCCIFVNLSWLQRVRNTRKWRAVTETIIFQRDLLLKYVLCNSLAITLNFEASRARRPQYTITDVCVWWTPLIL